MRHRDCVFLGRPNTLWNGCFQAITFALSRAVKPFLDDRRFVVHSERNSWRQKPAYMGEIQNIVTLRVRYSETDQMGTFYNSRALSGSSADAAS